MSVNTKLSEAQKKIALMRTMEKQPKQQQAPQGMMRMLQQSMMPPTQDAMGMMPTSPEMPMMPTEQSAPSGMIPPPTSGPLQAPPTEDIQELNVVEQQVQAALIADQLWKDGGGSDSLGGSIWEDLKDKSGKDLESARDYFIRCFVRWSNDPEKFAKNNPTEAKLIQQLNDAFEAYAPEEEEWV